MAKRTKEEEPEELEIDLNTPEPLNKKQKRLLKKGKIDENKHKVDANPKPEGPATGGDKKSEFGVWIGNLSFDTSRDDLVRLLAARDIPSEKVLRIHMPLKAKKNQGFAYADFDSEETMQACIKLSETHLNGRNLLIKNAKSFAGRPAAKDSQNHKPSRILFVGNLPFDTTEEQLETHFQHCGTITRVRMATFEDSGKCKGFAFIDFLNVETAVAAFNDKGCKKLNGRPLRMEYGEDRSKKRPGAKTQVDTGSGSTEETVSAELSSGVEEERPRAPVKQKRDKKEKVKKSFGSSKETSGMALANAQRASTGIVESKGKKITF